MGRRKKIPISPEAFEKMHRNANDLDIYIEKTVSLEIENNLLKQELQTTQDRLTFYKSQIEHLTQIINTLKKSESKE